MPYVSRNREGELTGLYRNRQPGRAVERLAEDDAEVVAYRNPMLDADQRLDRTFAESDQVLFEALLEHENRLRALESEQARSAKEYRDQLKLKLP